MLTKLVLSILLVSASVVGAAVKPGENLLINGTFESQGSTCPSFWDKSGSNASCSPTGGPGKTGILVFSNPEGLKGISSFCRQHDQQIIAGETYKMSTYVKTLGFKSAHCGVIVHDNGWYKVASMQRPRCCKLGMIVVRGWAVLREGSRPQYSR